MGITFKVHKKNGDYIRASVVPGNHADEPHFGLLDATIVAVFLLGAAGLIYLFTLN